MLGQEPKPAPGKNQPTKEELFKIKLSLSSLRNSVVICPAIAVLYTPAPTDSETWIFRTKGVPVLILNQSSNGLLVSVKLGLSDHESGFLIWQEQLSPSSEYKAVQDNFHTFKMISRDNRMAGIRFPPQNVAQPFLESVHSNTLRICKPDECPDVSSPSTRRTKFSTKKKSKLRKEDISRPCLFSHVARGNSKGPCYHSLLI